MADFFKDHRIELDSPGQKHAAVTPNDSTDLADFARSLYIGVTGDVKVTDLGGIDITWKNVPVGDFPHGARRVWATGTTATEIIATII